MQPSSKQQAITLAATALTLALGAVSSRFPAAQRDWLWLTGLLLVMVWGGLGIWTLRRAARARKLKLQRPER